MRSVILFTVFVTLCFTTSVWSQNYQSLDPRIKEYYTETDYNQIVSIQPRKLEKIIFLYTASFHVMNLNCTDCMQIQNSEIDIHKYEHFRKQSTRFRIGLNRNGDMLELLSQDELDAQYNLIDNQ